MAVKAGRRWCWVVAALAPLLWPTPARTLLCSPLPVYSPALITNITTTTFPFNQESRWTRLQSWMNQALHQSTIPSSTWAANSPFLAHLLPTFLMIYINICLMLRNNIYSIRWHWSVQLNNWRNVYVFYKTSMTILYYQIFVWEGVL